MDRLYIVWYNLRPTYNHNRLMRIFETREMAERYIEIELDIHPDEDPADYTIEMRHIN